MITLNETGYARVIEKYFNRFYIYLGMHAVI